jgi:SAM-dependent methyltransferase
MEKRPWRKDFFRAIAQELSRLDSNGLSVLELGSGPGFLARHILDTLPSAAYVALDFSPAMHALAKEHIGALNDRVRFLELNFKDSNWSAGLPVVDAVLSFQAVHELRHKRHTPSLYRAVRALLRNRGIFLMCDHFVGEGGMSDTALYMTPQEHEFTLRAAGFSLVQMLRREGGLILFRAEGNAV